MPPRAKPTLVHYEVVKIGKEWCLRNRTTQKAVAWTSNPDAGWHAYCAEQEASMVEYLAAVAREKV